MKRAAPPAEFPFTPRIINPVKMAHAVIFSADEDIRKAREVLGNDMPWLKIHSFFNPMAVSDFKENGASVFILDDTSFPFLDIQKIRANNADAVLVLLTANDVIQRSPPSVAREKYPYTADADLIFAVNLSDFPPGKVITSAARAAEDLINIEKYSRARRFIFLIVDDEPRWFSQFLPVLYNIIGQRADVKLTRTYEETIQFLFGVEDEADIDESLYMEKGRGDDVVCLITDIFFPKGGKERSGAGVDLIRLVNKYYPRIPSIIASKAEEADGLRDKAFVLPKGDPGSIETFRDYIYDFTGMGDFLISREDGQELYRLRHIGELYDIVLLAEEDTESARELRGILESIGQRDSFSTWLYMHGFRDLADELRPRRDMGHQLISVLRHHLGEEIKRVEGRPLILGGKRIFSLSDLLQGLKTAEMEEIQEYSDDDIFSNWLDRKRYPELAEELRPIHASGERLRSLLVSVVGKWERYYLDSDPG